MAFDNLFLAGMFRFLSTCSGGQLEGKCFNERVFLCQFGFRFEARNYRHVCENSILLVQMNFAEKICFCKDLLKCTRFETSNKSDRFLRKRFGRVLKSEL